MLSFHHRGKPSNKEAQKAMLDDCKLKRIDFNEHTIRTPHPAPDYLLFR